MKGSCNTDCKSRWCRLLTLLGTCKSSGTRDYMLMVTLNTFVPARTTPGRLIVRGHRGADMMRHGRTRLCGDDSISQIWKIPLASYQSKTSICCRAKQAAGDICFILSGGHIFNKFLLKQASEHQSMCEAAQALGPTTDRMNLANPAQDRCAWKPYMHDMMLRCCWQCC
jgi:hypothetical protein